MTGNKIKIQNTKTYKTVLRVNLRDNKNKEAAT